MKRTMLVDANEIVAGDLIYVPLFSDDWMSVNLVKGDGWIEMTYSKKPRLGTFNWNPPTTKRHVVLRDDKCDNACSVTTPSWVAGSKDQSASRVERKVQNDKAHPQFPQIA